MPSAPRNIRFKATITGVEDVKMRLNQELNRIKGGTRRGLIKVGFVIKAQSMKNAPIDTSNLRASHYVWWKGGAMETPSYNRNGRDGEEKLTESDLTQLRQAYQEELSRAAAEIRDFEIRIGASAPIGNTSISEPRTANSPCSVTCGTR